MSKMGTLHLLVQEASRSEEAKYKELLEDFLEKQCNFKSPKQAANQFIKAFEDLEEKAKKVGIKLEKGLSIWTD